MGNRNLRAEYETNPPRRSPYPLVSPELSRRYQRYIQLLESFPFREEDLDYSVLDRHLPFLERLDEVGNSAISVFDLCRREHVYTSARYRERLGILDVPSGLPVEGGLDGLMHPGDLLLSLDAGYENLCFILKQPPEERRFYKAIHDFRLRKSATEWTRVVEQHVLLETDPDGNIWLSLSIVDVSPDQDLETPFRASIVDVRTDDVFAFAPESRNGQSHDLSSREREVLSLVAGGQSSSDIAGQLFLSVHTVNRHRQNILRKTNAQSTAGAIRYALERGLI